MSFIDSIACSDCIKMPCDEIAAFGDVIAILRVNLAVRIEIVHEWYCFHRFERLQQRCGMRSLRFSDVIAISGKKWL
ncbi:MAG: hypothetical protein DWQ05_17455 [Calditrichaeota bacterium]|nr:MAG: hypothetical protein DWQ05_17455 [Calditrichota bacterium]